MTARASHAGPQEGVRPLVGLGVLVAALGVLAILAPLVAGLAIAVLVGTLLVLAGLAECYVGLQKESRARMLLDLALGVLAVLAGVVMLANPLVALASLTLLLAAYFFVRGAFELGWLARERDRGWGWTLMDGIASIALAVLVWAQWPVSGAWTVGLLAGVKMLLTGATMVGLGQAARHAMTGPRQAGPAA
jgi:uncharacterized membrane protein HdeD (DUF308 family)